MDIYEHLLMALKTEYDVAAQLKSGPRGSVSIVRHRKSGRRYVFHHYCGSGTVYRRLLPVSCPHLPQIFEAGTHDGQTAVLEEFIIGDTQILGTTGFAAPGQYGITQTDARADIYALGVLLNGMLTGERPSRGLASGRLGRIVEKCTMIAPEKRYRSVEALEGGRI